MAQTQVPSPQRSLLDIDQMILQEDIRPLVTPAIIEEHRQNPIGFHSDELERVLIYLRKNHLDMAGKYVIVCRTPHADYRIGVLSGTRGVPPQVLQDEQFSSREDAEHGVFLRRLKDLGLMP
jgi:hypothetical protein